MYKFTKFQLFPLPQSWKLPKQVLLVLISLFQFINMDENNDSSSFCSPYHFLNFSRFCEKQRDCSDVNQLKIRLLKFASKWFCLNLLHLILLAGEKKKKVRQFKPLNPLNWLVDKHGQLDRLTDRGTDSHIYCN